MYTPALPLQQRAKSPIAFVFSGVEHRLEPWMLFLWLNSRFRTVHTYASNFRNDTDCGHDGRIMHNSNSASV
jgi:hypothetical protein